MKFFVRWACIALACSALVIGCGNEDETEDEDEAEFKSVVAVQ